MDLKTWRCEHEHDSYMMHGHTYIKNDSTVRRLGPQVGFWNMAVTFLILHIGSSLNSSSKTCTGHIHLLKFIYRLLKHYIHVNISHVKMGCKGKKGFIAWLMLCSAFGVKATDL
jgi:hypothetical protein